MATIYSGNKSYNLSSSGLIYPNGSSPSNQWRIIGAVRFNNFGREIEHFSLDQILSGEIQWKYKNGKQRVHLIDSDHGTLRIWITPPHRVAA